MFCINFEPNTRQCRQPYRLISWDESWFTLRPWGILSGEHDYPENYLRFSSPFLEFSLVTWCQI